MIVRQNNVLGFIFDIQKYNLLKIFPGSQKYFEDHFSLPHQTDNVNLGFICSHYNKILRYGKYEFGLIGIICANTSLIFITLLLCGAADLFISNIHSLPFITIINILCFGILSIKFDLLNFRDKINILRIIYIFSSLYFQSYWSCVCIFLVLFENII